MSTCGKAIILVIGLLGLLPLSESLAPTWTKYYWASSGSYWRYYGIALDWASAQRHCQNEGAHLAIVDNGPKLHKVARKVDEDVWIGLSNSGGHWKWISGSSLRGGNWFKREPRGGDCVFAQQKKRQSDDQNDGKWRASSCNRKMAFICEAENTCVNKNPCLHGGKCTGKDKDLSCQCPTGFQGRYCEQDKRPCISYNPCKNNAHCTNRGTDYTCSCPPGFQGKDCEIDKRPCVTWNPCKNNAHCTNRGTDYTCSCPAGFQGKNCQIDKRPCVTWNPCKNNAHCTNRGTDYTCSCPAGFQGKDCEIDRRPCIAYNPCKNDAHCINKGSDYSCLCPHHFSGKNCEIDKRPCFAYNPCRNGGVCQPVGNEYSCTCKSGFGGKHCEESCHLVSQGGLPKKVDLIFLVDGSVSVKSGPFYKGLEFINKIVDHVDLSPTNGRVGFIEFAHKIDRDSIIGLSASFHLGKSALKSQILNTAYINGGTQISLALEEALTMFSREGRHGIAKYIMILSDGASANTAGISAAVRRISAAHIDTFAIGVGDQSKAAEPMRQLLEIAQGNSKRVFEVNDYDQLNDQILKEVLVSQCD